MLSFLPPTPLEVMENIKTNFIKRRKALGYTQKDLAIHSGVSLDSLKRFEQIEQISLESLLKLAMALECLGEFGALCEEDEEKFESIEEVISNE